MKNYKALVIGCGNIGSVFGEAGSLQVLSHAHAYQSHPSFSLEALVDLDLPKAQAAGLKWKVPFFTSIEEAFKNNIYDIVSICVSTKNHAEVLKKVAEQNPKMIILEKPITPHLTESVKLCEDFKGKGQDILVHYTRRFMPELKVLKDQIAQDHFGAFISGHCYYSKGILHNGSHAVDLIQYLLGDAQLNSVFSGRADFSPQDPTLSLALSLHQGGTFCLLESDQRFSSMFEMELLFEAGLIKISEIKMMIEEYALQEHPLWKGYKQWVLKNSMPLQFEKSFQNLLDHTVDVMEGKVVVACSLTDALASQQLCAMAVDTFKKSQGS